MNKIHRIICGKYLQFKSPKIYILDKAYVFLYYLQ